MSKFSQYSLVDFLVDKFHNKKKPTIEIAAEALYKLWVSSSNNSKIIVKNENISTDEVELIEKEGMAKTFGNKIEITPKGKEVIKIMALGDDRSALTKGSEKLIDYKVALSNVNSRKKMIKKSDLLIEAWWERFDK